MTEWMRHLDTLAMLLGYLLMAGGTLAALVLMIGLVGRRVVRTGRWEVNLTLWLAVGKPTKKEIIEYMAHQGHKRKESGSSPSRRARRGC
ncbi:hypothetical protein [Ferrimonas marina]|uniref:Uncharacterized protein n=1 Tax=Ferrimonas marina TaxID=299255 RepID=A0A1M5TPU0_9GAMM|nr:hypothetical protein [Ferrimonas marina]SHH52772.1 hypothetical protein SAMN02745129_2232 [Ferrimonas marina]